MDINKILSYVDHTLLAQGATWDEIKAILDDGIRYSCASCHSRATCAGGCPICRDIVICNRQEKDLV